MSRQSLVPLVIVIAILVLIPLLKGDGSTRLDEAVARSREEPETATEPGLDGEISEEHVTVTATASASPTATPAAGAAPVVCSEQSTVVLLSFTWEPLPGALEQWLDVSNYNDGFKTETRKTAGPLSVDLSSFTWPLPDSATPYYWRINTRTADGWQPSPVRMTSPCAATGLEAKAGCSGEAAVEFSWTASPLPILVQWLEVSTFDNGFVQGTFTSVGPVPAEQTSVNWQGIPGNAVVWRVHTLTPRGWRASDTMAVPTCDLPLARQPRYTCTGDKAVIEFNWLPVAGAQAQWIDVSYLLNGFAPGTFVSSGSLQPETESYLWAGIDANVFHYYRVHALTEAGWRASVTLSFFASCPS